MDLIIAAPPFWKAWDWDVPTVWHPFHANFESCADDAHVWSELGDRKGRDGKPRLPHKRCGKCGSWFGTLGTEESGYEYGLHLGEVFRAAAPCLKSTGVVWLIIGDNYDDDGNLELVPDSVIPELPFRLRSEVIWERPNADLDPRHRMRPVRGHERIFMLSKGPHYYYTPFQELGADGQTYRMGRTIWRFPKTIIKDGKFEGMPPALVERFINTACPEAGTVLDPFCGSGTTLEVARRLGRNAIGIELSQKHCDIAVRRLSQPEQVTL